MDKPTEPRGVVNGVIVDAQYWLDVDKARAEAAKPRRRRRSDNSDSGRYQSGYRIFRDGSYREDFGSDR